MCGLDLNYRHRNAQMAGRASVELHTLIYFRKRYVAASPPCYTLIHCYIRSLLRSLFGFVHAGQQIRRLE
jgi:hypothetical protein